MTFDRIAFSTDDLPAQDREASIRDYYGQIAMRFDLSPLEGQTLSINADSLLIPGLAATAATIGAVDAMRTAAMRADGNSDIMIAMPSERVVLIEGDGDATIINSGEALVAALDRPIRIFCETSSRMRTLQISREALAPFVRDLDDWINRSARLEAPAANLLSGYVRAWMKAGMTTPAINALAARHVIELAVAAIAPVGVRDSGGDGGGVRAARLVAAKKLIWDRLLSPDLSPRFIARLLGVSPRYLRGRRVERQGLCHRAALEAGVRAAPRSPPGEPPDHRHRL